MDQQDERPFNATALGEDFAEEYFTVLHRTPELAKDFYAKHGQYCTVYSDGTTVVADNREDLDLVMLCHETPNTRAISVKSVLSVYDTPIRLLVLATGHQFVQSFVVDYQPGHPRPFTILTSVVTYTTAETNGQTDIIPAVTGVNRPSADTMTDVTAPKLSPLKTRNMEQTTAETTTEQLKSVDVVAVERFSSEGIAKRPPPPSTLKRDTQFEGDNVIECSTSESATEQAPVTSMMNRISATERFLSETTEKRQAVASTMTSDRVPDGIANEGSPQEATAQRRPRKRILKRSVHVADGTATETIPSKPTVELSPCDSFMNRRSCSTVQHTVGKFANRRPSEVTAAGIPAGDSSNLFIGRLPQAMSLQYLSDLFSKYGQVMSIKIKEGLRGNGDRTKFNYGFVKFDRPASAQKALADRPIRLDNGHVLNVQ